MAPDDGCREQEYNDAENYEVNNYAPRDALPQEVEGGYVEPQAENDLVDELCIDLVVVLDADVYVDGGKGQEDDELNSKHSSQQCLAPLVRLPHGVFAGKAWISRLHAHVGQLLGFAFVAELEVHL